MTATTLPPGAADGASDSLGQTPAKHHPARWRLNRGGIVNVWYYFDAEFTFSGGRCIWRGTNGAGKSRVLEMLLPFLLDADRRKMDATGGAKVRLEDLMKAGSTEQTNRLGYLWLELVGTDDNSETEYLTLGALIRFSRSTAEAKVWYFTTPHRVGVDLVLLDEQRLPLSRDRLTEIIGADRITESPEAHRDRVRNTVFALTGDAGRERFTGLLQLLHTLRSPDVGNRIEEGRLPSILSDALPPLSEAALNSAGEQLDALSETRAAQQRLDDAREHVATFLDVYRRYAAGVLAGAADTAQQAATDARNAQQTLGRELQDQERLVREYADQQHEVVRLEGVEGALSAQISGIKESKEYADARDLDQRGHRVAALAQTADRALEHADAARRQEADAVSGADARAADTQAAASTTATALDAARAATETAGVPGTLPPQVTVLVETGGAAVDVVRVTRETAPAPVDRPAPATVTVVPAQPTNAADHVRAVARAARTRAGQAAHRATVARDRAGKFAAVTRAEERADDQEQRASTEADTAAAAATARDDAAAAFAVAWRQWVSDSTTLSLLGPVDWAGTAVGPLLDDVEWLVGADADGGELARLDAAADTASGQARDRLASSLAAVEAEQADADAQRAALLAEQADLQAAHDPAPATPTWQTAAPPGAISLWRAIDFVDGVSADVRAGVEAAMLASGLLTAAVTDGTLTAADGQVLVTATGPVAATPLSRVVRVDPTADVDPALVAPTLERVAFGGGQHPVWVAADGTWGNGPLTGRHRVPTARHIGAQARAAARAARLAEIRTALAGLDDGDRHRQQQREALEGQRAALNDHLASAPWSADVASARAIAADAGRRADAAAATARELRGAAAGLRDTWSAAHATHEDACRAANLPAGADELVAAQHAAETAATACENLASRLVDVASRLGQHATALDAVDTARERRAAAEESAEGDWAAWHSAEEEFAALRANIGREAERVRAELQAAEDARERARLDLRRARATEAKLGAQVGAAVEKVAHARERVDGTRGQLDAAADALRRTIALPGVVAAAVPADRRVDLTVAEVTPAVVESAAKVLARVLDRRGGVADENALVRAQQTLERDLSGTFDVIATISDGVRLVELTDATGRRHLADAATEIAKQAERGRAALSDRERRVFTDFVLGGVAEELRRRLGQAKLLVDAMNGSLGSIRTSHGIGVKVRWTLSEDPGSPVARIRDLVALAGEVRTAEQNAELTELIKDQVNAAFAADATTGYAAHLKAALDYRRWHDVEVIILGPARGQERRISRRAKLSQGETRFVSYVTLFGAVDAYLSGLPDRTRALRLILLDDAFAKVDDRTIAELMGLLVRLDIDFAMTGHALWGCYPQVPALDVYEVRRRDGTAAVTTHVHWDGRTRHLRPA